MFLRLYPAQIPAIRRLLDTFDVWLVLQHFVGFGIHFNAIPCHFITKTKTASTTTTQPTNSRFISLVFLHFCLIFFFWAIFRFIQLYLVFGLSFSFVVVDFTYPHKYNYNYMARISAFSYGHTGCSVFQMFNIITLNMRNPISCSIAAPFFF